MSTKYYEYMLCYFYVSHIQFFFRFRFSFTQIFIFMSSQQPFTAVPVVGEVQHVAHLSDHLGKLYLSEEYSDVLLVLEDNDTQHTIPAHKVTQESREAEELQCIIIFCRLFSPRGPSTSEPCCTVE